MNTTLFFCIVSLPLVLIFSPEVFPYKSRIVSSQPIGACMISLEANDEQTLRVRIQPGHPQCYATSDAVRDMVYAELSRPSASEETYTSISLGRLIDYPWLSGYLAKSTYNDPEWQRNTGKHRSRDTYRYVAKVLLESPFVTRLNEDLANRGYTIRAVTVEKVLIGGFRDVPLHTGKIPHGKIPFDAIVWLRLQKR